VPQCELVEGDGLAVGTGPGGLGACGRRVAQDPGGVVRRDRVVGEHARIGPNRLERVGHPRVQRRFRARRDGTQDRRPRDLVPEDQPAAVAVEQACRHERFHRLRRHRQRGEQRGVDDLRRAGQELQALPHRRGQPCGARDDGVADALGQRRLRLLDDLADVEGVARGAPVDVVGVEATALEEPAHGRPAQRGQLQAPGVGGGDEVAEDRAQGVVDADGVAVRQHHQERQRRDPPGEEPHEVKRRLVAPVQVLHDQRDRVGAQGVQHGREDLVLGRRRAVQQCGHGRVELVGDVTQRAEGTRRAQRVAHPPEHAMGAPHLRDERAQEHGLADPRLAGDQHEAAVAGHGSTCALVQHVQGMLPLQQQHAASLACRTCPTTALISP
jgi:hypothetical protein